MVNINGTEVLIPPPDGYVVDFENPQQQFVIKSYTVAAVEMTLAFLFLIQRLYTKVVIMKKFQLEDSKLQPIAQEKLAILIPSCSHRHCRMVLLYGSTNLPTPRNDPWSDRTACLGNQHRQVWLLLTSKTYNKSRISLRTCN